MLREKQMSSNSRESLLYTFFIRMCEGLQIVRKTIETNKSGKRLNMPPALKGKLSTTQVHELKLN